MQGVDSIFDLVWNAGPQGTVTYGDVFHQNEVEMSRYNFEAADTTVLFDRFEAAELLFQAGELALLAGVPGRQGDDRVDGQGRVDIGQCCDFGSRDVCDHSGSFQVIRSALSVPGCGSNMGRNNSVRVASPVTRGTESAATAVSRR